MKIDINKKYQTREGYPARIISTDLNNDDFPVAVAVAYPPNGQEEVYAFTNEGKFLVGADSDSDLTEIIDDVVVNLYLSNHGDILFGGARFADVETARKFAHNIAGKTYLKTIVIEGALLAAVKQG